jgi:hypothetical protein
LECGGLPPLLKAVPRHRTPKAAEVEHRISEGVLVSFVDTHGTDAKVAKR